jgi:hypothetical protein
MEKEFTPYEEALALKELGFDEPCLALFINGKFHLIFSEHQLDTITLAPTFSQAFRWFRKKYNFHHYIEPIHRDGKVCYEYCVVNSSEDEKQFNEEDIVPSYEEAELECLKKLIEIAKDKK